MSTQLPNLEAHEMVTNVIENHFRHMEKAGHGTFTKRLDGNQVQVSFGPLMVRAASLDAAMVLLAGAMLDDEELHRPFLAAMRSQVAVKSW